MASNDLFGALAIKLDASDAQVKFALLAGRFEDYGPVLGGSVLKTLRSAEDLQFSTEGAAFGEAWPPLAPSTIEGKERAGVGNRPIMVRTGLLRNSLTTRAAGSIAEVSRFALTFGTSIPYAVYHQQTTGPGKGIIPLRRLIPQDSGELPAAIQSEIATNIRDYLIDGKIS